MRKFFVVILALSVGFAAGCAKKSGKDTVASVNGKDITLVMLDEKIKNLPAQYQSFAAQHKREVVDEMIVEELLYDEARRRNIDREEDVKKLVSEAVRKILISKLIEQETKKSAPVSEDDAKAYYDEHKDVFMIPEMVRASHILTNTEETAKEAKQELDNGADFAETAKKYSEDLTKDRGGDLGYFKKGQMIPEFEKVCFELNPGETSDIVKTRFGYHIIKATDRKPATYRSFDEVKDNVTTMLVRQNQAEKFEEFAKKLKSKAKIDIDEAALAPAPQDEAEEAAALPTPQDN